MGSNGSVNARINLPRAFVLSCAVHREKGRKGWNLITLNRGGDTREFFWQAKMGRAMGFPSLLGFAQKVNMYCTICMVREEGVKKSKTNVNCEIQDTCTQVLFWGMPENRFSRKLSRFVYLLSPFTRRERINGGQ